MMERIFFYEKDRKMNQLLPPYVADNTDAEEHKTENVSQGFNYNIIRYLILHDYIVQS